MQEKKYIQMFIIVLLLLGSCHGCLTKILSFENLQSNHPLSKPSSYTFVVSEGKNNNKVHFQYTRMV